MKVVFPTCCEVDVHKLFLVAIIIKTPKDSLQPGYQKKRFSTFNSDLNCFVDWLHKNECLDVCIESTGKYWVPVFNILEKQGIRVVIANPKWVKAVKGNKDDTKDSKWIGDLFRIGLVKSSFIPAKDIRILAEDGLASIEGYEITPEEKYRIGIVRDHLHYIKKLIERVDTTQFGSSKCL